MSSIRPPLLFIALGCAVVTACSSSSNSPSTSMSSDASVTMPGTPQTPPTGGSNVEAWIAEGYYKQWNCESAVHASRSPSVHNFNRICSNDVIASNAGSTAPWPEGAAAVKELYQAISDTTPVGYAVYLKTAADSASGANWYFYERVPTTGLQSAAPHDTNGVVADGFGTSGPPLTICVSCHGAAGSDAAHTPSPGGHDFVYTPVSLADVGLTDVSTTD
jgi:hypothetical protein